MGRSRAPRLLFALLAAILIGGAPLRALADAGPDRVGLDVDRLWNPAQGVEADSALFVIQSLWDTVGRRLESDRTRRGLMELQQANSDLLNSHSVLTRQRKNEGPARVPLIDPILSGFISAVTGQKTEAPLGSLLAWINQTLLALEGRGSPVAIVENLLRDFGVQQRAAAADLAQPDNDAKQLWTLNSDRQRSLLGKVARLAGRVTDGASLAGLLSTLEAERQALLEIRGAPRAPALAQPASAKPGKAPARSDPKVPSDDD